MKQRIILTVLAFLLAGCGVNMDGVVGEDPMFVVEQLATGQAVSATPSAPTVTPSPTIGYQATIDAANRAAAGAQAEADQAQATALAAQATAQAAAVAIGQMTAQAEQLGLEYARMTQQVEAATLTAAPTAISLTATQQVEANALARLEVQEAEAKRTESAYAPTATVVAAWADAKAKTAVVNGFAQGILMGGLGAALAAAAVYLFWRAKIERDQYQAVQTDDDTVDAQTEDFLLQINEPRQMQYAAATQLQIPAQVATREQLRVLAAGIAAGKRLSFSEWTPERNGFSRPRFAQVMRYLIDQGIAEWVDPQTPSRGATTTPLGLAIFEKIAVEI